jgi:hypothetical protein
MFVRLISDEVIKKKMGRTKTLEDAKSALVDETSESVNNLLHKLARESKLGRLADIEMPKVG